MRTYKELKAEEYDLLKNIALKTEELARQHGCFRAEDGTIQNYFTAMPNKTGKPCWSEWFDDYLGDADVELIEIAFNLVFDVMLREGISIGFESTRGWYIGGRGEQGYPMAWRFNDAYTRLRSVERTALLIVTGKPS